MYYAVGGLLPIGWAAEGAIGMSVANPGSKIIAVTGDGGMLMGIQCIATAVEQGLPIVWIIFNNSSYNAIAVLQRAYFGEREGGSDFVIKEDNSTYTPDYAMIGKGFGAEGEVVEKPGDIGPAMDRALASDKPYVLDCRSSREGSRHKRSGRISWEYLWRNDRE
jgi:acetolactate synthase-1/2/3 large subunit